MEGLNEAREVQGQVVPGAVQVATVKGLSFCSVETMNEARLVVEGMLSRAKESGSGEELARAIGKK